MNDGKTLSEAIIYCINTCNHNELPEDFKVAMVNLMLLSIQHTVNENGLGNTIVLHPNGE